VGDDRVDDPTVVFDDEHVPTPPAHGPNWCLFIHMNPSPWNTAQEHDWESIEHPLLGYLLRCQKQGPTGSQKEAVAMQTIGVEIDRL
jgi:hypothetical protein